MKDNIRILGIDDGPFQREKDWKTPIVAVLMRVDGTIESVHVDYITIDGDETLSRIKRFVGQIGKSNVNVILAEGVTFGGFDIISPDVVFGETGIPFISITKGKGDIHSMEDALKKHNDERKISRLRALTPIKKTIGNARFTLNISGIDEKEAITLVRKLMKVGNVPEPLRIADMIAFAIVNGLKNMP